MKRNSYIFISLLLSVVLFTSCITEDEYSQINEVEHESQMLKKELEANKEAYFVFLRVIPTLDLASAYVDEGGFYGGIFC